MRTTIDLLEHALKLDPTVSQREWSRRLKLSANALGAARHVGRLSVETAVRLAVATGQDPGKWALVAIAENDNDTRWASQIRRFAETAKA